MKASTLSKYSKNTIPTLIRKATEIFNEFIRLRDSNNGMFTCISCRMIKDMGTMNAGHYMSAGNHGATRFHEDNVHGQCVKCNNFLSGHLEQYRKHLIDKIGLEKVEALELRARMVCKIDRYTLVEIIEKYTLKVAQLKAA